MHLEPEGPSLACICRPHQAENCYPLSQRAVIRTTEQTINDNDLTAEIIVADNTSIDESASAFLTTR